MGIYVDNDYTSPADGKPLTEVEIGTAFLGTVEDSNGEEREGLFFRTYNGVVWVEDLEVEFDTFSEYDSDDYVPKVRGYVSADVTVRVDEIEN